jgi:hypothetical protein
MQSNSGYSGKPGAATGAVVSKIMIDYHLRGYPQAAIGAAKSSYAIILIMYQNNGHLQV